MTIQISENTTKIVYSMTLFVFSSTVRMSLRSICMLSRAINLNTNIRFMSYKSKISLDKIYPQSADVKPFKIPESNEGKFTGFIPIKDLKITYMAASGPGGQHVNKTETKVDIRFHVDSAKWLSESTKQKLKEKLYTRMNKEGYFIVRSEKTKSQLVNQADAITYLRELIFKLEEPDPVPSPESIEKARKNKEKAARIRLMEKRSRAFKKTYRGSV